MEIKLITTNVTTSGGGVKFRFLGNVEIKKRPIIFGTAMYHNYTVRFVVNGKMSGATSNDEGYFELCSDEIIKSVKVYYDDVFGNGGFLNSLDVSNLDTSQVTNMNSMFRDCWSLTSLDVSHFNTSQVTDMSQMFSDCEKLTSLDLTNFNTSQVTDMHGMFFNCSRLTSLDLSNWNTSKVYGMTSMFGGCSRLTSLDLSNWVKRGSGGLRMFEECTSLRTIKINDKETAENLIGYINYDLKKTATWNPETKIITIPA